MNKTKQKKATYNDTIVKGLMERYDMERQYILKAIRGERSGKIHIKIQEEYNKLNREANVIINNKINNL